MLIIIKHGVWVVQCVSLADSESNLAAGSGRACSSLECCGAPISGVPVHAVSQGLMPDASFLFFLHLRHMNHPAPEGACIFASECPEPDISLATLFLASLLHGSCAGCGITGIGTLSGRLCLRRISMYESRWAIKQATEIERWICAVIESGSWAKRAAMPAEMSARKFPM